MSPVSRRRPGAGRPAPAAARLRAVEARKLRAEVPLDALTTRIARLGPAADGFAAEAVASGVLEVVASRGPDADETLARFSRAAVSDPRAGTTPLGLQAMAVLALHGHRGLRDEAAALVADADAGLRSSLPAWVDGVGSVEVVEAGVLRTADGTETVLHLLLDHVEPAAGPRHLLSLAVHHSDDRVHLLDVRTRRDDEVLAPVAERYDGSTDPVWTWGDVADIRAAAEPALRVTAGRTPAQWPVQGIEGGETLTWSLGTHRLEQVVGTPLL
jgi:hypothetical protein